MQQFFKLLYKFSLLLQMHSTVSQSWKGKHISCLRVTYPKSQFVHKAFYVAIHLIRILAFSLQFCVEFIQAHSYINQES